MDEKKTEYNSGVVIPKENLVQKDKVIIHGKPSGEYGELREVNDQLRLANHYLKFIKWFIIVCHIIIPAILVLLYLFVLIYLKRF